MRAFLGLVVGLAVAILAAIGPALGREEILLFESNVQVDREGVFTVTETIQVRAEGRSIKRGIFRDFPTLKRDENGFVHTQSFDVVSIERDGKPEPWHTEAIKGGTRVYIGNKDVFLNTGVYTYRLTYRTARQIGFLADRDEIYWNATGNFWVFDIKRAVARITLPEGAEIGDVDFYTGAFGTAGKNARIVARSNRSVTFETTEIIGPGEGLTVAVGFQKGLIDPPSGVSRSFRAVIDNSGLLVLVLGVLGVIVGYFTVWHRVGRDPEKGLVIPLFAPPRGLSPAAVSFIHFRGLGASTGGVSRAFVAALVSLGVKGRIKIDEIGNTLRITRLASTPPDGLPSGERAIEAGLFSLSNDISVDRSRATVMQSVLGSFAKALSSEHGRKYFNHHLDWAVLFLIASIVVFFAFLFLFPVTDAQGGMAIFSVIGSTLAGTVFVAGARRLIGDVPGGSTLAGLLMLLIGGGGLAIAAVGPLVLNGYLGDHSIETGGAFVTTLILLAVPILALVNVGFAPFLYAPTQEGAKVMAEIEGFKLYLSVAESERLNMAGRPDFSVDLYERFLPYAVALGVEKPWSNALDAHFANALPGEQQHDAYRPRFYSGSSWRTGAAFSASAMASTLGSSFASAMPRSSGSSGGGSSGGGGGGGGGGGW